MVILGPNAGNDVNDTSTVSKIQYVETLFLFTGDARREAERAFLNAGVNLSDSVLKVVDHGSDTSTTHPFLREIMPLYAVNSVGKVNRYDYLTDNALSRFCETDLHDDVFFLRIEKLFLFPLK